MPKRNDLKSILIIGSGPIIISQACEFDYSGTQACKALKQEGYRIVLINSNPATIMTDPEIADATYIEPITPEIVESIIEKERPDAVLPTLGGQTALNTAVRLYENGVLEKYGVEMIGAKYDAITCAENREKFRDAMLSIGLDLPKSGLAYNIQEARKVAEKLGYPIIIRPGFTLGGTGGGIAYNAEEFERIAGEGLSASMINEILIEESVIGWKEFELEVMRDLSDNVVIICSIENFDPMGVHTGDSITVAPAQTLTDREYQYMRDASLSIIRKIGVETGGSNIQFAINPKDGRMVVIEMNPRVSRSSALASKATGFPIAKIAAKLAVGYTLDEIPNDITKETMASFEPTIDYCVVKLPRFTFEKFPGSDTTLGISMKSVGEVMAIGRTFREALQKGLRSLETGHFGLGSDGKELMQTENIKSESDRKAIMEHITSNLSIPTEKRLFYVRYAYMAGMTTSEIADLTGIDPWFCENMREITLAESSLRETINSASSFEQIEKEIILKAKRQGFSDRQISVMAGVSEERVRVFRSEQEIKPVFKLVDTCGAEFEAYTPYYYSTYEQFEESPATKGGKNKSKNRKHEKVMILGGGPNRIGQGIEFDYCCVQASFALREEGIASIMVNNNPETVSTDYDVSDRLYFEPLTREDVLEIIDREKPDGVIVQFGGQTPLNLAVPLLEAGAPIIGTSPDSIDRAEDRDRFKEMLSKLGLRQPDNGTAMSVNEAEDIAVRIGYPVLVRPSYVLGGRGMEIVYNEEDLVEFVTQAVKISPNHPVLIDRFLESCIEVDVDAVSDKGGKAVIAGIMEHIEEAGVHSGDSACVLPPHTLSDSIKNEIAKATYAIARELGVIGLMNIQFAVKNEELFVLEVNPRASRTIPFVSKATGISWAQVATKVMLGMTLDELEIRDYFEPRYYSVKEVVLPFSRFKGTDIVLGPEMKSTGEVMGIDVDLGMAFAKSQTACGTPLPPEGNILISVKDRDKPEIVELARSLAEMGYGIIASRGTAKYLKTQGIDNIRTANKVSESRPHIVDYIMNDEINLIINTPSGRKPYRDQMSIRSVAIMKKIPLITTISAAKAAVRGMKSQIVFKNSSLSAKPVQEWHSGA